MLIPKQSESQKKNLEAIGTAKQVDISVKGLSERTNKQIDENFNTLPISENFITTQEKSRGIVKYPLLLIENITEQSTLDILKQRLSKLEGGTQEVKVMYRKNNKAVSLCDTRDVPEILDILLDYCVNTKYFVSKGKIEEIKFESNFDFNTIKVIEDESSFIPYKDRNNQDEQDEDLNRKLKNANEFIEKMLNVIDDTKSSSAKDKLYDDLGLEPESTVEIIEKMDIVKNKEKTVMKTPTDNGNAEQLSNTIPGQDNVTGIKSFN